MHVEVQKERMSLSYCFGVGCQADLGLDCHIELSTPLQCWRVFQIRHIMSLLF